LSPVARLVSGIDLLQGTAGDLAAVEGVEARARQPHAVAAALAPKLDQADMGQMALEVAGVDVAAARQPSAQALALPQPRPVGEQFLVTSDRRGGGSGRRQHGALTPQVLESTR